MTLGELAGVASAIGTLVALGTTIWNVLASGSRQNKGRLDAHEAKLVSIDGRVASLEQWVKSLPSTTDMHKIELSLARMEGELSVLAERLQPVAAIAERMQELLLQQSKR